MWCDMRRDLIIWITHCFLSWNCTGTQNKWELSYMTSENSNLIMTQVSRSSTKKCAHQFGPFGCKFMIHSQFSVRCIHFSVLLTLIETGLRQNGCVSVTHDVGLKLIASKILHSTRMLSWITARLSKRNFKFYKNARHDTKQRTIHDMRMI